MQKSSNVIFLYFYSIANNQANPEKNVTGDCNKTENTVKKLEGESDTKTSITSDLAEKSASNKEPDSKKFVEITKRALWDVWIKKLRTEATKLSDRSKYVCLFFQNPWPLIFWVFLTLSQTNSKTQDTNISIRNF